MKTYNYSTKTIERCSEMRVCTEWVKSVQLMAARLTELTAKADIQSGTF